MTSTVFVANLPFSYNEVRIKDYFKNAGQIQSVVLAKNEQSSSYGMAFIRLKDNHEATRFCERYNKTLIEGRMISVKVADHDI